jgi:hypothetical protein
MYDDAAEQLNAQIKCAAISKTIVREPESD